MNSNLSGLNSDTDKPEFSPAKLEFSPAKLDYYTCNMEIQGTFCRPTEKPLDIQLKSCVNTLVVLIMLGNR